MLGVPVRSNQPDENHLQNYTYRSVSEITLGKRIADTKNINPESVFIPLE
jgi:hypothetical protein